MTNLPPLSRRKLMNAGIAGIAAALASPAILRAAQKPLRVGTYKGGDEFIISLASNNKFPYPVEYSYFSSGQLIIEAVNAGALDYGSWSEIPQAFAAGNKAQIRAIAVLRGRTNDQVVLVRNDAGINNIAELKGKRVGYVRATTSHYYLLRMLSQAGLSFSDIQAINLSPTDGGTAFSAGALDAWAIYGYPIYQALESGHARVLRTAEGILSGNYLIGASPNALADPELRPVIADYVERTRRSYAWAEAHKSNWISELGKVIPVKPAYIEDEIGHENQPEQATKIDAAAIQSTQLVADTFVKVGLLPPGVDVKLFFDSSLITS